MSANVIFVEEAAFIDTGVFFEVIVPLMGVKGTATICISTPRGPDNFYSELTEVRDERGRRIFKVRHIRGGRPPPWKPEENRPRIRAIYAQQQALYKQEAEGEIMGAQDNAAFHEERLKRFFERPRLRPPYPINDNMIYVAVDPNNGMSSGVATSETAVVSFTISHGRLVVRSLLALGFLLRVLGLLGALLLHEATQDSRHCLFVRKVRCRAAVDVLCERDGVVEQAREQVLRVVLQKRHQRFALNVVGASRCFLLLFAPARRGRLLFAALCLWLLAVVGRLRRGALGTRRRRQPLIAHVDLDCERDKEDGELRDARHIVVGAGVRAERVLKEALVALVDHVLREADGGDRRARVADRLRHFEARQVVARHVFHHQLANVD